MLDACLTRPILRWDSIKQQYHLSTDVHSVIREVQIITDLLLAWRVWDRAPLSVWKMAFEALELLVSGSHASCAFNVKQLQSAAIVNRLLLICLVSPITRPFPSIYGKHESPSIIKTVSKIFPAAI